MVKRVQLNRIAISERQDSSSKSVADSVDADTFEKVEILVSQNGNWSPVGE
jgi:hypothetical protein